MNGYDKTKNKEERGSKRQNRSWSWSWRRAEIERQSFPLSISPGDDLAGLCR